MKKLKLNFDKLKVESFEISASKNNIGTVKAHQEKCDANSTKPPTQLTNCDSCYICPTPSVDGTCYYTCFIRCTNESCAC